MNLEQIEAIENALIRNVLATCWNFAEETEDREEYGCDICDYLFNREHYTISIPQTEQDTADLGVWDCINLVVNYEEFNFGEVNTEIYPFQVANMVNYIAGYHLLGKSEHLTRSDAWDRKLTKADKKKIQKELRDYIESLSAWSDFWGEVCAEYDV